MDDRGARPPRRPKRASTSRRLVVNGLYSRRALAAWSHSRGHAGRLGLAIHGRVAPPRSTVCRSALLAREDRRLPRQQRRSLPASAPEPTASEPTLAAQRSPTQVVAGGRLAVPPSPARRRDQTSAGRCGRCRYASPASPAPRRGVAADPRRLPSSRPRHEQASSDRGRVGARFRSDEHRTRHGPTACAGRAHTTGCPSPGAARIGRIAVCRVRTPIEHVDGDGAVRAVDGIEHIELSPDRYVDDRAHRARAAGVEPMPGLALRRPTGDVACAGSAERTVVEPRRIGRSVRPMPVRT